jgi:hypothetical protein
MRFETQEEDYVNCWPNLRSIAQSPADWSKFPEKEAKHTEREVARDDSIRA